MWATVFSGTESKPVMDERLLLTRSPERLATSTLIERLRGKPYVAGYDEPRKMGSRKDGTSTATRTARLARPTPTPSSLTELMTNTKLDKDALTAAIVAALAAAPASNSEDMTKVAEHVADRILKKSVEPRIAKLEGAIEPLLNAATGESKTTARMRVAATVASGNVFLDKLTKFYQPGKEAAANVLLASPPSFGKSYAIRMLGDSYDVYLEHGCSDDMDEIATLLGSPVPDGKGGFVVVDGVLTEAVRAAESGKTVLLMLDEVLRLTPRAQEWLLTFLTGVKRGGKRFYRLRTRHAIDGNLEVIECPSENLHIVAATNLSIISPIEAFWSRWETVRVEFTVKLAEAQGKAILDSYGVSDPDDKLSKTFAGIINESRQRVADSKLKYPADFRILERAAACAPRPDRSAVAKFLADRLSDNVANWNPDTGDLVAESEAVVVPWKTKLMSL